MTLRLVDPIGLPLDRMAPEPDEFAHASDLHGEKHVARVMIHAFLLLEATGKRDLAVPLWASVFIHDLARTHDGRCERHGADAAALLDSRPTLLPRLRLGGLGEEHLEGVRTAVTHHSHTGEMDQGHPHWPLLALLKDADGLDRVRLGDLDPSYLRLPETPGLVPFAERLYLDTDRMVPRGPAYLSRLWPHAERILTSNREV